MRGVEAVKNHAGHGMDQSVIDNAILMSARRGRLRARVRANVVQGAAKK